MTPQTEARLNTRDVRLGSRLCENVGESLEM